MRPKGYIICSTPRSGSTLLCRLLTSTGRTGDPHSFYRQEDIPEWAEDWGVPPLNTVSEREFHSAYLEAAISAGRSKTGVFGLRLMHESLSELLTVLNGLHPGLAEDREVLERAFGDLLFIHLHRDNTLAQAISLVKAEQTGLWHKAPDGTEIERLAPQGPLGYDFELIQKTVNELETQKLGWKKWFDEQSISPLTLNYDGLSKDPAGVLIEVCEALNVEPPKREEISPGTAKLADKTNADWTRRYLLDKARRA